MAARRLLAWLAWVALLAPGVSAEEAAPAKRPSFLLILADDMGRELGAYGDAAATTPRIDALGAEGLRFENAYVVAPTCSPSRAALYTGQPPHVNGHWGFPSETRLRRSLRTAPQILREAGYFTGNLGKLHVRGRGEQFPFDYERSLLGHDAQTPQALGRRVARFLEKAGEGPFFLVVNTRAPHAPYPGEEGEAPWPAPHDPARMRVPEPVLDTPAHRESLARMYDAYSLADSVVGGVLDALAKAGRADATVVLFLSDQGPAVPGGKATLYEAGVRVPMLVRWPGVVAPGRTTPRLVSSLDVLPTLREAAGLPADAALPGRSLVPLLRGGDLPEAPVHLEQTLLQGGRYYPQRGLRVGHLKYIRNLRPDIEFRNHSMTRWTGPLLLRWGVDPEARALLERYVRLPREELYDLAADPEERNNLAGSAEHAESLAALRGKLRARMEATQDPWLALWDHDASEPDPLQPTETVDGAFEPRWLDAAVSRAVPTPGD